MTALSKATLKATWVANFKPQASDFANLIDSWTDYYAGLESLGAQTQTSANGVAVYNGTSARIQPFGPFYFRTFGNVAGFSLVTACPVSGIDISQNGAFAAWVMTSGYSVSNPRGYNQIARYNADVSSAVSFPNAINITTYTQGFNAVCAQATDMGAMRFWNPKTVSYGTPYYAALGDIVFSNENSLGQHGEQARIRARNFAITTAAAYPTELLFCARSDQLQYFSEDSIQFRVRPGYVLFEPKDTEPTTGVFSGGEVYFDNNTKKLRCFDGTSWNDLF